VLFYDISGRKLKPEANPEFGAVGSGFAINDPEVGLMYETYQADRSRYYIVELDGVALGGGGIAPLKGGDGSICEIQKMYFYDELRGKGAGSKLLDRLLVDAKAFGFKQAYLETMSKMTAAQNLYHHKGFEPLKKPWGQTGHGGCDVWFAKAL
jgi:putative acetyltransferase